MNIPSHFIYRQIEKLIEQKISFALYRMPWTEEPLLAMENADGVETLSSLEELSHREGFLIAPFKVSPMHPIVLIHHQYTAHGWEEIEYMLKEAKGNEYVHKDVHMENEYSEVIPQKSQKETYCAAFGRYIDELRKGRFKKLVLARNATYEMDADTSPLNLFVTACNAYPRMMISFSFTPYTGVWIGSSPEIILSGSGDEWHTVALAGTMPIEDNMIRDEWSLKNTEEQAYVSEYIRKVLKKYANEISENGPYTARAGQLQHLKTDFCFRMKSTSHLGELIEALHPTPAVCGLPKQEAYDFITGDESFNRKYYSGIIGPISTKGITSLYVNLRCMNLHKDRATLYAGGGILASSVMEAEWKETLHKMNTMRRCLEGNIL